MSLLDDIKSAQRPNNCAIKELLAALKPADRADLETALADPTIFGTTIAVVLAKRGFLPTLSKHTIQRHRRGDCACKWTG